MSRPNRLALQATNCCEERKLHEALPGSTSCFCPMGKDTELWQLHMRMHEILHLQACAIVLQCSRARNSIATGDTCMHAIDGA
jgi:hypothetical protein